MKKQWVTLLILIIIVSVAFSQSENGLKIFISVDMEGITGVVNWEDVSRDGKDYEYFRQIMTKETNAAIEGALEAGVTRTGDWELTYKSDDLLDIMKAFSLMH